MNGGARKKEDFCNILQRKLNEGKNIIGFSMEKYELWVRE